MWFNGIVWHFQKSAMIVIAKLTNVDVVNQVIVSHGDKGHVKLHKRMAQDSVH